MITRRQLLGAVGSGWLADHWLVRRAGIQGAIVGASHTLGHLVREHAPSRPSGPARHADVVVVGAGASGVTAAWRLRDAGLEVLLLELEPFAGGTSSWGDDGPVSHPWGAHYLPAPNPEARAVTRLLSELGVIVGWDAAGRPRFRAEMLCHAPDERLFYRGAWHPGLVPEPALEPAERAELARFSELEEQLTDAKGSDGRYAFQLPFEHSSRDPRFLELDRISMAEWLDRNGFASPFVRWWTRYATLDDFGGEPSQISAWAGWHYWTARKLRTEELAGSRMLVWPEGNGWLLARLLARLPGSARLGVVVTSVRPLPKGGVEIVLVDPQRKALERLEARAALLATPANVTRRILAPAVVAHNDALLRRRPSAPWLVANLHVRLPVDPDLPWDSVLHDAAGLGYVHAGHQRTRLSERTVLTYYRAYGAPDAAAERTRLLATPWERLASEVLADLRPAHPDLAERTERLDVMLWGHGMPRPVPGFLGARPFATDCLLDRHLAWAHVDQTGFALFEEATQRGVRAAEALADAVGAARGESWL